MCVDDTCPNCIYVSLYLLTCFMILFTVFFVVTGEEETEIVWVLTIFVYMMFQCSLCVSCCDNTYQYLKHAKSSSEVEALMNKYIKDCKPEVSINVRCWHTVSNITSAEGGTSDTDVTTFNNDFAVPVLSYTDCTEVTNGEIDLHKNKLTMVKLQKSIVPDQNFLERKKQLHEQFKDKDRNCDVTENMHIDDFEGQRKPCLLNPKAWVIAHLLVFPSLPFRIWVGSITGKVHLEIRKQITTEPPKEIMSE